MQAGEGEQGAAKAASLEDSKQRLEDERLRQSLAEARFPATNKLTTSPAATSEESVDR